MKQRWRNAVPRGIFRATDSPAADGKKGTAADAYSGPGSSTQPALSKKVTLNDVVGEFAGTLNARTASTSGPVMDLSNTNFGRST